MESVIMTTPGNNTRLKSRLRSAANTLCARTSRNNNRNNIIRHVGNKNKNIYKQQNNFIIRNNTVNKNINNFNNKTNGINNLNCDKSNNNGNDEKIIRFPLYKGILSREVYDAWCGRLGDITRVPGESVQALFNDMQLYPSETQVSEMLQCARRCGRRNNDKFLTFGEFCVFAGELRRNEQNRIRNQIRKTSKSINNIHCEVFLGGSCNPTTWRADIAIPTLTKLGISYYNPQVSTWGPELMEAEHDAKESASVLLFVIDSQTRCITGMIEVAHLVAKRRCLVLVVHPYVSGQNIMDEPITSQEYLDLTKAQLTLLKLLKYQGIKVHNNLTSALQSTAQILRGNNTTNNHIERKLTDKLMKLREMFDKLDDKKTGELSMSEVCLAYCQFTNSMLSISDLYSIMDLSNHTNPEDVRINFEQFCAIIAEFTENRNNTSTRISEWVNSPLQRQTSTNNSNFDYTDIHKNNTENSKIYDVYLGGSCLKKITWRRKIAIPLLKKYGATYYNPSLCERTDNYLDEENLNLNIDDKAHFDINVMENSKVLLFVITNETRCITSTILAAYFMALKKNVVLCIQNLPLENCIIGTDMLTKLAIKDYNRARAYLSDMAKHEHVPVYESVTDAVQCAINLSRQR